MNKTYFFHPDKNFLKQGYLLEDENNNIIYEAKMLKNHLFGAIDFSFVNHINNKEESHKVGHTVTLEESSAVNFLSIKSQFKFDEKNIWDYLHEKGIRIDSNVASGKLGMAYDVSFEGKNIATVTMSSPNGKSIIACPHCYDVTTTEDNLELVFLVTFAIARTDQVFYN